MSKDIKISDHLSLWKTQPELDFVDIYVYKDIPLFLDPWAIRQSWDDFSNLCHNIISDYFESLLKKIRSGDENWAMDMLSWLWEPSETHLWLSKNSISWSWVWPNKARLIYEALSESKAVKTWFLNDLEDTALLIEWIKEDNISDMVTNLLRFQLIKYTQEQCNIHWIQLRDLPTWYYWNNNTEQWESSREPMLVVEWKKVILIPKFFVRKTLTIDFNQYYNFDVLEFEQALHVSQWSALCKTLKDWTIKAPTKKALKEYHPESKKHFVYEFTKQNPKILEHYKKKKADLNNISASTIIDESINEKEIIDKLISKLTSLGTWKSDAYEYERVVWSILEIIFYPNLFKPTIQYRMLDWLKIVDICYENSANIGFFSDIIKAKIACRKIYFECKNYNWDIKNEELDQLNWRFSDKVSEIWFIVCRKINNKTDYERRIKFYTNQQHYIISLEDQDLINLLNLKKDWKSNEIDKYLNQRLNNLTWE